jgi:hypothetical protein
MQTLGEQSTKVVPSVKFTVIFGMMKESPLNFSWADVFRNVKFVVFKNTCASVMLSFSCVRLKLPGAVKLL